VTGDLQIRLLKKSGVVTLKGLLSNA